MSEKSVEHCYVIQFIPPNKFNERYYFSVQEQVFVPLESATRFRDADVAKAYAKEFGVTLDKYVCILHVKDL